MLTVSAACNLQASAANPTLGALLPSPLLHKSNQRMFGKRMLNCDCVAYAGRSR